MDFKAQMSSPFELLVAIIIMSFVVIIGSQMLANVNDQVCLAGIDKELTEFKENRSVENKMDVSYFRTLK